MEEIQLSKYSIEEIEKMRESFGETIRAQFMIPEEFIGEMKNDTMGQVLYGISPALKALPSIKEIEKIRKRWGLDIV